MEKKYTEAQLNLRLEIFKRLVICGVRSLEGSPDYLKVAEEAYQWIENSKVPDRK